MSGALTSLHRGVFATLLLVMIMAGRALAVDYYISPSGDDNNTGLAPENAWQNLSKVYTALLGPATLQPGDRILLEGGQTLVSNGVMYFNAANSGSAGNPVVIGSYGVGRATVDGLNSFAIFLDNAGFIEIENLIVTSTFTGGSSSAGIFVLTNTTAAVKYDGIKITNTEVSNFIDGGITIGTYGTGTRAGFENLTIDGCSVHGNGEHGIKVYGEEDPTDYNHSNLQILNSVAFENPGNPATTKLNTGHGIVISQVDQVLVQGCISYRNGSDIAVTIKGPMGIWLYDVSQGLVEFCESYEIYTDLAPDGTIIGGGGIGIDGGSKNCVIQYCYTHDNEGPGYLLDNYDDTKSTDGLVVRFNISQNDARDGVYGAIYCHKAPTASLDNMDIYHNTVYMSASSSASSPMACINFGVGGINSRILGNIFYTDGSLPVIIENGAPNAGLTIQKNLYFSSGVAPAFIQNGTAFSGVAAWQASTGFETDAGTSTALTTDPGLNSPGTAGTVGDASLLSTLTEYQLSSSSTLSVDGVNLTSDFGINVGPRDFFDFPIPMTGLVGMGSALEVPTVFAIGEGLFEVAGMGSKVELTYTLDPEDLIDYIEAQVMSDGEEEFRTLGRMEEAAADRFRLEDIPQKGATVYYRLKVVQIDGRSTLTDIRSIKLDFAPSIRAHKLSDLSYRVWLSEEVADAPVFQVFNLQGQVVSEGRLSHEGGGEWLLAMPESLPQAIHWLRVITPNPAKAIALP